MAHINLSREADAILIAPCSADFIAKLLHGRADDLRYRVREAVIESLARIGERSPEDLVHRSASWMDGYFHSAAVLRALADDRVIDRIDDTNVLVERINAALLLCDAANRAMCRYPGYKEVIATLEKVAPRFAKRFGAPVLRTFEAYAGSSKPEVRDLVEKLAKATSLVGRQREEAQQMKKTLAATAKKPRDPRAAQRPTRQRSKKA
jgi:hypothetical protein